MKRLALVAMLALAAAAPGQAQDKPVDLKISLWVPPAHPLVVSTREWAASITKASGGSIRTTVFPSEQLGKAFDHYDMARDGIADITYVNPGYQPGRFPIIAVGQIPFTFSEGNKGSRALDAWYRNYAGTEMKDTRFCLAMIHSPGTVHSRRKITTPEDLKGVKVRPAQSTIGQLVSAAGGTNVQSSAPEARDMIERGVADAIFFPWGSVFLFGIDKVVKFHIDEPLYTTVFTYNMNQAKYDAMSPAQRKVMDEHCNNEWAEKLSSPWTAYEFAGRDKMAAAPGHEVYKLTPEQKEAWQRSVDPLQKSWAEAVRKAGADPDKAMADLKTSIATFGAGF
jgi:TRAP-type C4-dicarboxylate transport system substrate-binding protein